MANETVPRYAELPSGSLFQPVSPERIEQGLSTTYWITKTGSKVTIECKDENDKSRCGIYSPIPVHNHDLVRRFLFRGTVLAHVLYCQEGKVLTEDMREAIVSFQYSWILPSAFSHEHLDALTQARELVPDIPHIRF